MNYLVFILSIFVSVFKFSVESAHASNSSDPIEFYEDDFCNFVPAPSSYKDLITFEAVSSDFREEKVESPAMNSKEDGSISPNSDEMPYEYERPKYQLRTQVKSDLDLLTDVSPSVYEQLTDPILCLGTGRLKSRLVYSHLCPTFVGEADYCVDINKSLNPDDYFNVFDTDSLEGFYKKGMKFGVVYFSHLGSFFPHDFMCCNYYYQLLKPGGSFLYKSYAYLSFVDFPRMMSFKAMDEVRDFYKKLFKVIGFENIQVMEKPEPADLIMGEIFGKSLLIYAEKPKEADSLSVQDKVRKSEDKDAFLDENQNSNDEEDDLEKTLPYDYDSSEDGDAHENDCRADKDAGGENEANFYLPSL